MPKGYTSANEYLNQVICVKTKASAIKTLKSLQAIELLLGRKRNLASRYSDRTIDLDILYFNSDCLQQTALTLPHPRISERAFVLKPLMQLCPEYCDPFQCKTVRQLYQKCKDKQSVKVYSTGAPKLISVMGPMGSGKSYLAKQLSALCNATLIAEQHAKNAFLLKYYKGEIALARNMEQWFLQQHNIRFNASKFKAWDTLFISDFYVDQNLVYAQYNLNKTELKQFTLNFNSVKATCVQPDVFIFLTCKPQTAYHRIKKRQHAGDSDLTIRYLNHMHAQWMLFFKHNHKSLAMHYNTSTRSKLSMNKLAQSILKSINQAFDYETWAEASKYKTAIRTARPFST